MEIPLTFRRKDFQEIFYSDNKGNLIQNPMVRQPFLAFAGFVTAFLIFYSVDRFAVKQDQFALFWLQGLTALGSLVAFFWYFEKMKAIMDYRQEVKVFLDKMEKGKVFKIYLDEHAFTYELDGGRTIERWTDIKSASISPELVSFYGSTNYTIPSKSMSEMHFQIFTEFLEAKIKGIDKVD